ncbi:hypothetical protein PQX77_002315 [Marasmius sp. AFHP31]|nr:hypothetical protein PQX77_002315 [Marasmius sp. AFHP31]
MPSTFASPSAFTPDDHIQVFFEALVEFGFKLVDIEALFSNPGFENLLCSAQFEQLLCRFPPQDLSDRSLEVLIRMVTNGIILENLSDEELVPPFVTLLANMLEQKVHRMGAQKSIHRCWLSLSTEPGSSTLHKPTNGQIMTIHPTFPLVHLVQVDNKDSVISYNSVIPSEFPLPSTVDTHPSVVSDIPQRSHRLRPGTSPTHKQPFLQLTPSSYTFPVQSVLPHVDNAAICLHSAFNSQHASRDINHVVSPSGSLPSIEDMLSQSTPSPNTLPVLSALPSVNGPLIYPGSAINSQVPRCCTNHTSPSSGFLASNRTISISSPLAYGNDPVASSQPTLSKGSYKLNGGATQRLPKPGSRGNVLDEFSAIPLPHHPGTITTIQSVVKICSRVTPVIYQGSYTNPTSFSINGSVSPPNSGINTRPASWYIGNHQRGIGDDGSPYCQSASPSAIRSAWSLSAFASDHSVIPISQEPYGSPHLVKGSVLPAVENSSDLALSDDVNSGHKPAAEPRDTEHSQSTISLGCFLQSTTVPHPAMDIQAKVTSGNPRGLCTPRPLLSTSHCVNCPLIHPGSAINLQVPGCPISHVSKPLSPNQTSVRAEQPTSNWWDRDWSSDSLFSSDSEEEPRRQYGGKGICSPDLQYDDDSVLDHDPIGLHRGQTANDDHVKLEFRDREDGGPQSGYWDDLSYNSDDVSQQSDDSEDSPDDSPDSRYKEKDVHHPVTPDEIGCDHDLEDGLNWFLEEDNGSFYDRNAEPDHHYDCGTSECLGEQEAFPEDGANPEFEDNDSVGDNGKVKNHFGDEEPLFDGNSNDNSTHLELEESGDGDLFWDSGDDYEEYNDGASQRSEDWSIPPDEQSDQGYESPCENDKYYEDEDHQYEYGNDEGPYHYLALIPQHFPRTLWSLQLPKSLHLNEFTKYGPASEPSMHYLFDITLIHTISTHIPLLITLAAFKLFVQSTIHQFIQGLQLSRQFVTPLKGSSGTDVIVEYQEHILLPIEHDDTASKIWDEDIEVTHDAIDELFGVGSTSIFSSPSEEVEASVTQEWHPTVGLSSHDERYESSNSRDFTNPNSLDGWRSVEPYAYDESQLNDSGHDTRQGYLALIPPSFPLAFQHLQSPKTRNQSQSWTTGLPLHEDTVHTPGFAALVSVDRVKMFDEEAVTKTASNQHPKRRPINKHNEPGYLFAYSFVLNPPYLLLRLPKSFSFNPSITPILTTFTLVDEQRGKHFKTYLYNCHANHDSKGFHQTTRTMDGDGAFPSTSNLLGFTIPCPGDVQNLSLAHFTSSIPTHSFTPKTVLVFQTVEHNTELRIEIGIVRLEKQERQLHDILRQNNTISQGKNEHLNGGVKTLSLTLSVAHFSLVTFIFLVTLIFLPVSHPEFAFRDNSPPTNIVENRTARNRRGGSPSLLDMSSPSSPSQISIEDARFQINQSPCRSSPHLFLIDQFPPPFARSALDFRDGIAL